MSDTLKDETKVNYMAGYNSLSAWKGRLKVIFAVSLKAVILFVAMPDFDSNTPSERTALAQDTCDTIRIDAGSTATYTDHLGNLWSGDSGYTGGIAKDRNNMVITETDDLSLYQTERYDMSRYTFDLANCTYRVTLHFAETFFTTRGERRFAVAIEGETVLNDFDPFAVAGGSQIAVHRSFITTVSDGNLEIRFSAITNFPMINAIEIVPSNEQLAPVSSTNIPTETPSDEQIALPTSTSVPTETTSSTSGLYYVSGNNIFNANGATHRFHGVSRSGLELDCNDRSMTQEDFNNMKSWNANVVRIPLNQDFWLANAVLYCSRYAENIDRVLGYALNAGLDVIFDLHWSDAGNLKTIQPGQQLMADQNSLVFWQEFATKYANHPDVIFELYNEPHDIPWDCWLNGCTTSEGWQAVGMQQLYDAVRSTGANNIVIIAGLNWGYDLSGVPDYRVNGENIVYASHVYDFSGKQPADWDSGWGFLTDTEAVIVSEFGNFNCTADYYTNLLDYAEAHNQTSWVAWAWTASGCEFPSLLQNADGTPSDPVGVAIQNALLAMPSD
jgi:endoglucanase